MQDEQTIRNELAIAIKDLRARGAYGISSDAMDDNDIIFNTGHACALAKILGKDKLGQTLHTKFVSEWY